MMHDQAYHVAAVNGNGQNATEKELAPAEHEGQTTTTTTTTTTQLNYSVGGGGCQGGFEKAPIIYESCDRSTVVDEIVKQVRELGVPLYIFRGKLVEVREDSTSGKLIVVETDPENLQILLERYFSFFIQGGGEGGGCKRRAGLRSTGCPRVVAAALTKKPEGRFHTIKKIADHPVLREDGTLLLKRGFNPPDTLLVSDYSHLVVPDSPTQEDIDKAKNFIEDLIKEFYFKDEMAKAAAIAAMATCVIRDSLDTVPIFVVRAPIRGAGKTTFVKLCATIRLGHPGSVIGYRPDDTEMTKRIESAVISNKSFINLDNFNGILRSETLGQLATEQETDIRKLGGHNSESVESTKNLLIFANGNNIIIDNDLLRRVLLIEISIPPEYVRDPLARPFSRDILTYAKENRDEIFRAFFTLFKAYVNSGFGDYYKYNKGLLNFENWNKFIRWFVIWLGYPDIYYIMANVNSDDIEAQIWESICEQLYVGTGGEPFLATQMIKKMEDALRKYSEFSSTISFAKNGLTRLQAKEIVEEVNGKAETKTVSYTVDCSRERISELIKILSNSHFVTLKSFIKDLEEVLMIEDEGERLEKAKAVLEELNNCCAEFIDICEANIITVEKLVGTHRTIDRRTVLSEKREVTKPNLAALGYKIRAKENRQFGRFMIVKSDKKHRTNTTMWQVIKIEEEQEA